MAGEAPTSAPINLDLTQPIRNFCELVMRSAITNKMWKDGMRVSKIYFLISVLGISSNINSFNNFLYLVGAQYSLYKSISQVEAYYKKRKELRDYLPTEERHKLRPERKSMNR